MIYHDDGWSCQAVHVHGSVPATGGSVSLKESASQAFVGSVLQTFRYHDYAAFLTEKNHRSVVYSGEMWALAVQPGKCAFIRLPKPTHENTRIRTEPFSHDEKGHD